MKNFSDVLRAGKRWSPYAFVAGAGIWLPKAEAATLVNVDVTGYPLGPANTLTNTGTVPGDFISSGTVVPVVTNIDGVMAVAMTDVAGSDPGGATGAGQQYKGPSTPTAVGGAGRKTIEAWIFDPGPRVTGQNQIQFEKTIFSMGRRLAGGNFALEHGLGEDVGALSAATEQSTALGSMGWGGDTNVVTNAWVYLVATYDGRTLSVYSDGVLRNSETYDPYVAAINTALRSNDNSTDVPMRIARQTLNASPAAAASGAGIGPFYLGRVRVKDTNMTSAEVLAQYNSEKSAFNYTDSDSNGMADWWEIRYFGAIGQNPAGDPDGDGLTNLQEYNARTNPNLADTDGDGLSDAQEVNVTLTDPTKADTDGDGLSDGYEVNTSLTNPRVADSDGDGFSDGVEVAKGTNPNSAASFPGAIVNLDATGLPLGNLTNWVNGGSLGGTFDAVQITNTPKVTNIFGVKGVNFTTVGGGGVNGTSYMGPAVPTQLTGSGPRTIEAWVYNSTVQDEETMFAWGARGGGAPDGRNVSFGIGRNGAFGAVAQWGQPDIGWNNQEVHGRWVNLAYTYDGTNTTRVYVDGKQANVDIDTPVLNTQANGVDGAPYHFRIARQNVNINAAGTAGSYTNIDGTGFGEFTMSRIRVYDVKFDEPTLRAHFNAEKGTYGLTDTDGDGMPDWYEDAYGLNKNSAADAGLDPDGDGLTNLQEYQAGYNIPTQGTAATIALKPNVADTDGDGANDGAELARVGGFYGPAGASPTNPFNPDTDNDGLKDGVETDTGVFANATHTGTSPLKFDCDNDGFSDGLEVSQGSNPNDITSTPNPAPIVNLIATNQPLGALNVWTNSGQFGGYFTNENGGGSIQLVQGVNGLTMPGLSSYVSTNAAGAGLVTGNPFYTVEAWVYNPSIADEETIIGWGRRGGPDGTMSAFTDGSDGTWGAITHWGAPDLSWSGANVRTPTRWKYLAFTYNPLTQTQNVYTDGGPGGTNAVLANTEILGAPLAIADSVDGGVTHLPFRVGDETAGGTGAPASAALPGFSFTGTIGEVRVYSRQLTVAEMGTNITKGAAAYGILNDTDGLPIWWKRFYGFTVGVDVSNADPDGDGLSNAGEYANGTNPLIADTDGDGLSDGFEVANSTNPNNADTSIDGLPDGRAVALGLDPRFQDSDGDGFDDATEVLYGTNPLDGGSMPDLSTPRPFVNLDATALPVGPLPVWTNNNALGWSFVASPGAVANVQIVAGTAAVMFNGTNYYTGLGEPYSFATNASRTVEAWVYDSAVDNEQTVLAWGRRGGPDGSNCALSYGRDPNFGAIQFWAAADLPWGTNAAQIVSNTPSGAWTHIAFTYNNTTSNRTCYVNGAVANSSSNFGPLVTYLYDPSDPLNAGNPPIGRSLPFRVGCQNGVGGAPDVPFANMAIARIKAYNTNLAAAQIAADYNAEKVLFPGQPLITKVGYNPVSKAITFDWTPNPGPGRSYRIETNSDLANPAGWGPAATGLSAGPFTNSAATSQKFYRIRVD